MIYTNIDGLPHSTTGPAIIADGEPLWCVHGKIYTNFKDFQIAANLSDDEMTIIILKYGNIINQPSTHIFYIWYEIYVTKICNEYTLRPL